LIDSFQGFDIVPLNLVGHKAVFTSKVLLPLEFEITTRKAAGQFLKEIILDYFVAVGAGDQPAIFTLPAMGRAKHLGALKKLPARVFFRSVLLIK
jgi:hypothetical protein